MVRGFALAGYHLMGSSDLAGPCEYERQMFTFEKASPPPTSAGVVAARNNGHDKWWKICFAGKMSCLRGAKSC